MNTRSLWLLSALMLFGTFGPGQAQASGAGGPLLLVPPPAAAAHASMTEAAWSPDGRQIAFQMQSTKTARLQVFDLKTGRLSQPYGGPGMSLFPAWSPDGNWLVFSQARFTRTAAQGLEHGYNLMVVPAEGGPGRRLTDGLFRDYTPVFSPDGKYVYFSSTRGRKRNGLGLFRVPFSGGEPEFVAARDAPDVAYVSPSFSPDGKFIACAYLSGFRNNWALRLLRTDDPKQQYPLTDGRWPLYSPRWSPDGKLLACTGYRPGDGGWGVYIVEVPTGRVARVDTGPGNSRSPAWSPDGRELVFENNRTGRYRLYRITLPKLHFIEQEPPPAAQKAELVLHWSFGQPVGAGAKLPDLSGKGNRGVVQGTLQVRGGGAVFTGSQWVFAQRPQGCDFGPGAFSVQLEFEVARLPGKLQLLAVGDYPTGRQGWQVFIGDDNRLWFNSRDTSGRFVGARTNEPLPVGRRVTVVGLRRATGRVDLYLDGMLQDLRGAGATMSYPQPRQVRVGAQFNGKAGFSGTFYDFKLYRGELSPAEIHARTLQQFLSGE